MTKEKARELAEIMLAYADGKEIQYYRNGNWWDTTCPSFYEDTDYRIKPKSKTVPLDFSDAQKLIGAAIKHKNHEIYCIINSVTASGVHFGSSIGNSLIFADLNYYYTFADGTPISKVIEE